MKVIAATMPCSRPNSDAFNSASSLHGPVISTLHGVSEIVCKAISRKIIELKNEYYISLFSAVPAPIISFFLVSYKTSESPLFFSRGVLRYFTQTWWNNSFWCLLRHLPSPQDVGHLRLRSYKFVNPFYNLNCSAQERVPWRRVTEKSHFSTLNVGLAGTGNRTQATCSAGSVTRRSAIHYAFESPLSLVFKSKSKVQEK
jgi:hypothetical protein